MMNIISMFFLFSPYFYLRYSLIGYTNDLKKLSKVEKLLGLSYTNRDYFLLTNLISISVIFVFVGIENYPDNSISYCIDLITISYSYQVRIFTYVFFFTLLTTCGVRSSENSPSRKNIQKN